MQKHVLNEWRKILYRVRRHGFDEASQYVIDRVMNKTLPLALSLKFINFLLRGGNNSVCGQVLYAVKKSGSKHPLTDKAFSSWLWCIGKKQKALSFILRKAKGWNRSYLYAHAATLYTLQGNREKADALLTKGELLAEKELRNRMRKRTCQARMVLS